MSSIDPESFYATHKLLRAPGESPKGELLAYIYRRGPWQIIHESPEAWEIGLVVPEYLRGTEEHELRTLLRDEGLALIRDFLSAPEPMLIEAGKLTGKCGICGRTLTNPESVSRGIGPECATKEIL